MVIPFVRITGWLSEAIKLSEAHRRAVQACRAGLDSIWDPIRYIVLPMLRPLPILEIATGYIFEYGGRYYGFQRSSRAGLTELVSPSMTLRGSTLLACRYAPKVEFEQYVLAEEASAIDCANPRTWRAHRVPQHNMVLVGWP